MQAEQHAKATNKETMKEVYAVSIPDLWNNCAGKSRVVVVLCGTVPVWI
jgi:hypothetical protein